MKKWEYKSAPVTALNLAALGSDGWELCAIYNGMAYLKREAQKLVRQKQNWTENLMNLGISHETATKFLLIRKAKRMPLSDAGIKLIQAEALKAGITFKQAIEYSTENGYAGFKAGWITGAKRVGRQSAADAHAAAISRAIQEGSGMGIQQISSDEG